MVCLKVLQWHEIFLSVRRLRSCDSYIANQTVTMISLVIKGISHSHYIPRPSTISHCEKMDVTVYVIMDIKHTDKPAAWTEYYKVAL